jgi:predicted AlkP superfamily pyrophosphatase or phosphodiesterase
MNTLFYKRLGLLLCAAQMLTASASLHAAPAADAAGKAEHVLLLIWDGMRPDFVSAQYTPQLYDLAQHGVFFNNHHSVYITSTEVNGTALATGVFPSRSGIMANTEYRPEIGWASPNATEGIEMIRRGDLATGGKYIRVPTMCEIVQAAGFPTAVVGVKPVALLHDRSQRKSEGAGKDSIMMYAGKIMPSSLEESIVRVNDHKRFPTNGVPNTAREEWTGKALREVVWRKNIPKLNVVWLSEPDASQHDSAPGSDNAINALDLVDRRLTSILKTLEEKKVLDKTDIMIVSDHGFSTISRGFEVVDILKRSGFKAAKKFDDAEPGDVMVVGLGGSAFLYVIGHKEDVIRRLVTFLQNSDFAGVIFSKLGSGHVEGTFPLSAVRMDTGDDTPDIVFSFKWSDEKNDYDVPGSVYSEGGKRGKGTHASLSRFDVHNTLIAYGPSFKRGFINDLPSSNADVAPTILSILGIQPPGPMDGRVLSEALVNGKAPSGKPKTEIIKASRVAGLRQWEQYLKTTTFGGTFYVDEGNGKSSLRQP